MHNDINFLEGNSFLPSLIFTKSANIYFKLCPQCERYHSRGILPQLGITHVAERYENHISFYTNLGLILMSNLEIFVSFYSIVLGRTLVICGLS